jgi:hypothetical protein
VVVWQHRPDEVRRLIESSGDQLGTTIPRPERGDDGDETDEAGTDVDDAEFTWDVLNGNEG